MMLEVRRTAVWRVMSGVVADSSHQTLFGYVLVVVPAAPLRVAFLGQRMRLGPAVISTGVSSLETQSADNVLDSDTTRALGEIPSFAPNESFARGYPLGVPLTIREPEFQPTTR